MGGTGIPGPGMPMAPAAWVAEIELPLPITLAKPTAAPIWLALCWLRMPLWAPRAVIDVATWDKLNCEPVVLLPAVLPFKPLPIPPLNLLIVLSSLCFSGDKIPGSTPRLPAIVLATGLVKT